MGPEDGDSDGHGQVLVREDVLTTRAGDEVCESRRPLAVARHAFADADTKLEPRMAPRSKWDRQLKSLPDINGWMNQWDD